METNGESVTSYRSLCELETSLLMRGIQIGEMSKLVCLIGLIKHAIWADSLYFLYLLLLSISKIERIHTLKPSDQVAHTNFSVDMLERIDTLPDFLCQVCSDEATFHVIGVINRYNCRIWGSQNPHVTCELERGSPKVNMWAGLMHNKLVGPFFFSEKSLTGRSYLDILELYALPQLPPQTVLQQDEMPPHSCHHVRNHLDREMAGCKSPDLTPLDIFLWSYVKNIVYQVKINNRQHLKACIRDAVATLTPNMLQAMWNIVKYHPDICHATKGVHIEIY
jgi:hypothetical protein